VIIMESTRDHFKTIETNPLTLLDDLGYGFYHPVTGLRYADVHTVGRMLGEAESINVVCRFDARS